MNGSLDSSNRNKSTLFILYKKLLFDLDIQSKRLE